MIRNNVVPRSIYAHEGWTVVRLVDYFEKNGIESDEALRFMRNEVKEWLDQNVNEDDWEKGGVTKFSFRVQFANAEDALAFKLRFGIF